MKCRYCGGEIPSGMLSCKRCGRELNIVPEYNPLDDVLAEQLKGSISGRNNEVERPASSQAKQSKARHGSQGQRPLTDAEKRKRAAKKRARAKKRRQRKMILTGMFLFVVFIIGLIMYQFSYNARVDKGYKALQKIDYTKAENYFQKAIQKKPAKGDAYVGMCKVYIEQGKQNQADDLILSAVKSYSNSVDVYLAAFTYYEMTSHQEGIPILLKDAPDTVSEKLSAYYVEKPKFSLSDKEEYDDVQQVSLESSQEKIYYTIDGSDPFSSKSHKVYKEPIQISEGETVVKAVAVNEKEIPSEVVTKTYKVELPTEDAPTVTPSTGQYDTYTEITITVPEGYTAYYEMGSTAPDDPTENSKEYTGPIDMPEGTTIFKAVLVNKKGKLSGITTRNYELNIE